MDFEKRLKRRIGWDKHGVSEVIGTILTMTITVVLFSSIMLMVNRFPAPGDNAFVNFSGNIDPLEDWSQGAYINLTNTGGISMISGYTLIFMKIDDVSYNLRIRGTYNGSAYGLQSSNENWEAGDVWSFRVAPGNITVQSSVNVAIVDIEKDTVVWTHELFGGDQAYSPIISDGWVDSDTDTPRHDPIRFNDDFTFNVKVTDPNDDLDPTSVWVDMSEIGLSDHVVLTDPESDGTFEGIGMMGGFRAMGYYKFWVHASDTSGHVISSPVVVPVGQDIGYVVNLAVANDSISFSIDNPTHGDVITISAVIRNTGMDYTWADVYFYDGDMNSTPIGLDEILISGVDSQTAFITWRAAPGGMHDIFVKAVVRAPKEDYDDTDNHNSTGLSVLPTILLVDDDNHVNDRSKADTVSYMRSSLDSCSFQYDYLMVGPNMNGPAFDYGDYRLQNYDIVIWMTGYEDTSTLTLNDQANLQRYLNDTSNNRNNTGSLWLIGNNWLEDNNLDPAVSNFTRDYLHINGSASFSPPAGTLMYGDSSHIVSSEWAAPDGFEITVRAGGDDTNHSIIREPASNGEALDMLTMNGNVTAISFENTTLDERLVVFPWEFSRMASPSEQTQMAFRVIRWLGGINRTLGNDLAISDQTIDPQYVFYQQDVTISATIRNNGQDDLTNVQAIMYIDGVEHPDSSRTISLIKGDGGSVVVTYNWTASLVGTHIIKWRVDPNNIIKETNEFNNEVSDYLSTGDLIVEFRILVVDDDDSPNNEGTEMNETAAVKSVMDDLGYIYENHTVNNMSSGIDGPGQEILEDYSLVIWVTGNAGAVNALTFTDEVNIIDYMSNHNGRLWLIGENSLGDTLTPGFEDAIFGIQSINTSQALPSILDGVEDDPITHGMELQTSGGSDADTIVPITGASGILESDGGYYGVSYDSNISMSVVMTMSFMNIMGNNTDYINGTNARSELAYMIFHWFGKPDMRTELRITKIDFSISDAHPILGDAYILQATIHNAGSVVGNPLVRFMDGNTQIGSDSLSLNPDDSTTAEVIWRPLFAGNRNLSIRVDPTDVSGVDEIFEDFNNEITIPIYVYYFWDDMENRAQSLGKWDHYSTVVNINGENPIDYFTTSANMDTDVISDWNITASYGVDEVTDEYHTYDTSYFMEEPVGAFGGAGDVLVSIVIDNSESMTARTNSTGASWLDVAKYAAKHLISGMTDASVVSVYAFGGNNVITVIGMTPLAGAGRTNVNNAIDGMSQGQMTLIWDASGTAYMDVKTSMSTYPDLNPAVVVLSDGADFMSNDQSALPNANKLEAASSEWAPWHDMQPELGYPTVNYPAGTHKGKYAIPYTEYGPGGSISPNGRWYWAGGGSYSPVRQGLLTADLPIYTIGLALEHFDPVWEPVTATEPPDGTFDGNAVWSGGNEAGTVEYNLWRISNTSGAEYFYAPNPDDLEDIFETIGGLIGVGGFNQTRAANDPNVDKRAVTGTFSLDGIESARLTFWHKYDLIQGGNGAFLQVAYKDPTVDGDGDGDPANDWDYKYIIPPGQYSGGLYYNYDVYDDFGTLIKWCWNGVSGGGSYQWEHVNVDISSFVPAPYRDEVRIVFNYTQFGGGTGRGWWVDDVKLVVSRDETAVLDSADKDLWQLTNMTASGNTSHSGDWSWSNVDPVTGFMKPGIDNSLQTMPIDLTNARNAYLSAYLKFNINTADGMPPDGFRIEVSSNGGTSWTPINQGSRSSWGVSGTLSDASDGIPGDNKSYSGIDAGDNWVEVDSLTRVNIDLTNWRGNQILLRFRMVTNSHPAYDHYEDNTVGFGGFYVDDVQIKGESIRG